MYMTLWSMHLLHLGRTLVRYTWSVQIVMRLILLKVMW